MIFPMIFSEHIWGLGNSLRHLTLAACGVGGDLELMPPGVAAAYEKGWAKNVGKPDLFRWWNMVKPVEKRGFCMISVGVYPWKSQCFSYGETLGKEVFNMIWLGKLGENFVFWTLDLSTLYEFIGETLRKLGFMRVVTRLNELWGRFYVDPVRSLRSTPVEEYTLDQNINWHVNGNYKTPIDPQW